MNTNKFFKDVKHAVLHYRVKKCFFVASIRTGLIAIGYINAIITALLLLAVTAEEVTYTPPLMAVQKAVLNDDASTMYCIVAYAVELGFTCVLLCGIYRNDTVLLRIYKNFVLVTIVSTFLVYSMVFALMSLFDKIQIVLWNWAFQGYVALLVWSAIVEIKERNSENNTHITLYPMQKPEEHQIQIESYKPAEDEAAIELETEPKNEIPQAEKKNDETVPSVRKKGETVSPLRKTDETVPPVRKTDETVPPIRKTDETVPPVRKANETVPPVRKNHETVSPVGKADETMPTVRKDEETVKPGLKTETMHPEQKKTENLQLQQTNEKETLQPEQKNSETVQQKQKISKARFMSQWR